MKLAAGQVAVVTGSASGIGRALALAFAERGMNVVLADIDEHGLVNVADEIAATGRDVAVVPTDVTDFDAVEALAAVAVDRFGTVDVVCNNAGIAHGIRPVWEIAADEWQRMLAVNVWSVIHGIRAFVPRLIAQGSGHVVNTASMAGLTTVPQLADYVVSKHAVVALTESLRADLDATSSGVGATVLCPGPVQTPMADQLASGRRPPSPPIDPTAVAGAALAAIEANALYAIPAGDPLPRINARIERVLAAAALGDLDT